MARDENPFSDPNPPRSAAAQEKPSKPGAARTQSQDRAANGDKPQRPKGRKKGSQHADVIDRLDYSGVGHMLHHDGPFDACAPSRNKHSSKAPMMAWSQNPADVPPAASDGPYPSPNAYIPAEAQPRKKVDAIAEAWGIHEPEPYEEFFAGGGTKGDGSTPASSIYNGKEKTEARGSNGRSRSAARRSALPPPQPIFSSDSMDANDPIGPPPGSPGSAPKRSKSLMHRIRKMRDNPNVPVADYEQPAPSSPTSADGHMSGSRPTHRSQNSFLGRFGKDAAGPRSKDPSMSPTAEKPEPYVMIEPHSPSKKELPATPPQGDSSPEGTQHKGNGYFDGSGYSSSGGGVGRKTSVMKKMGRMVRGTK